MKLLNILISISVRTTSVRIIETMSAEEKGPDSKTVTLPSFSGEKKDYEVWLKRFVAYATLKSFSPALQDTHVLPADPENLTTTGEDKKKEQKAIAQNSLAIACLTMSFTKLEDLDSIEDSASTGYPGGVAHEVMKILATEYNPKDTLSAVEAETAMRKVKLSATGNPDKYFKKINVVKSKYRKSKKFSEESLIANTITNAPEGYHDTLTQVLQSKGSAVTMDDLKGA